MQKIIYYVATSIDGFIEGRNGDISGFVGEGNGVTQYLNDLQQYKTVIMGRKTYEFGYAFGLEPGALAYPHMEHYIFSETLSFDNAHSKLHIESLSLATIQDIRSKATTAIYLCGGGQLAGWLLQHQQIDLVKIKLNPLILGQGTPLFHGVEQSFKLELLDTEQFDGGLQIMTYKVHY